MSYKSKLKEVSAEECFFATILFFAGALYWPAVFRDGWNWIIVPLFGAPALVWKQALLLSLLKFLVFGYRQKSDRQEPYEAGEIGGIAVFSLVLMGCWHLFLWWLT